MTVDMFRAQMSRLMGLRFPPADLETHWEALRDVPMPVLEAAVTRAQKTRVEFPTPVELRQDADQVRHQPLEDRDDLSRRTPLSEPYTIQYPQGGQAIPVREEWRYDCETCSDTGWESVWCGDPKAPQRKPWHEPRTCDRRGSHMPHEWVRQCGCLDTNRTLIRRREAQRKYAEKPGRAS